MSIPHKSQLQQVVDTTCDRFEQAWRSGERPSIPQMLAEAPEHLRSELFAELLGVELELRAVDGATPDEAEYAAGFPEQAALVKSVFAEFRRWVRSTDLVGRDVRSHFIDADDDTAPPATDTINFPALMGETGSDRFLPESEAELLPRQFGRYQLTSLLGKGGMGTVYLAHDERLDRSVALKLPDLDRRDRGEATQRFYREARAMATVQHANLCPVFDVGEEDVQPYLTMAYLDGGSLGQKIKRGALSASHAALLVEKLANAVQAAHVAGVVHRDLKPSNVMLNSAGEPFITDFGLAARHRSVEAHLTHSGHVFGSPAYMAPEQVESRHGDIGSQTDVYALGVILYELLSGRRAFTGRPYEILTQIASHTPPPALGNDVPESLQAICIKAMSPRVADRYDSAEQLAVALTNWLSGEGLVGPNAPTPHARLATRKWKSPLVLLLAVGTIAFGVFLAVRPGGSTDSQLGRSGLESQRTAGVGTILPPPMYKQSNQILLQGLPSYLADVGQAVAIEGDTAVVGAPGWFGKSVRTGAVFVLERARDSASDDDNWKQTQILLPPPESMGLGAFGCAVALRGDVLVIGGRGRGRRGDVEAAYVYARADDGWRFQQRLDDPDESGRWFADRVAVGEGYIAVQSAGAKTGSVFVYEQTSDGNWNLLQHLESPDLMKRFASAFVMNSGYLVASEISIVDSRAGTRRLDAIAYKFVDGRWQLAQTIPIRETYTSGDKLPQLAMDRDQLVVGLPNEPVGKSTGSGAVELFRLRDGKWEYEQQINPPAPAKDLAFGRRVAIDEGRLLISATDAPARTRIVYPFEKSSGAWTARRPVRFPYLPSLPDDSLAVSGASAVLGDPSHADRAGRVHLLSLDESSDEITWAPVAEPKPQYRMESLLGNSLQVVDEGIIASEKGSVGSFALAGTIRFFKHDGQASLVLRPVKPESAGRFGELFAVDGDTLATTQPGSKRVEIFRREPDGFSHVQTLEPDRGDPTRFLGTRLALSGDWLAVPSQPSPGTLHERRLSWVNLYHQEAGKWRLKQKLQPMAAGPNNMFGAAVLMDEERLIVGAPGADIAGPGSGAAYVFRLQGGVWKQVSRLSAADARTGMHFGSPLSMSGNRLAVGCISDDTFGANAGAVYLFEEASPGAWKQRPEPLYAFDANANSLFGQAVCLSGDRLLVGADNTSDRGHDSGSAYFFYHDGSTWQHHQKLVPKSSAKTYKQHFGRAVAIHNDRLYVSAPTEYDNSGAIYIFEPDAE